MGHRWKDYEDSADHGPVALMIKTAVGAFIIVSFISVLGFAFGFIGEAATVVREEYGPRAALKKYEWFKDAAAVLEAKVANIELNKTKIVDLEEMYEEEGVKRSKWARSDREDHSLWKTELDGLKMSYNQLSAEYNAAMAKINWKFANVGELPPGATDPLPREFKPYLDK